MTGPGTPAAVSVHEVRPLRLAVLRRGQGPESVVWPGDDDPRAGHVAAYDDSGAITAVGSILPTGDGWRVRGMATAPYARGRGLGAEVLDGLIAHARAHGATRIWCNARPRAVPFYERAGFVAEGEIFAVPGTGPHRRMVLRAR